MSMALTSKQNDCRSCYKCIRHCPTKSISFQNGQASIIADECVMCGECYLVCPQDCKIIRDDLPLAKKILEENEEVYCSLAPSFYSAFPEADFSALKKALLALGFKDVEETAVGATIVKKEYDRLVDSGAYDVLISTCCHSINLLVEKHYPDAAKYLAPVLSPMLAHGKDLKRRHPQGKVIFVGPCISKKNEIEMYPDKVDCVLTFLELKRWLEERSIVLGKASEKTKNEESKARLFPVEGGILDTMKKDNPSFQYIAVGGMEEAMKTIQDALDGKIHHAFIEMSSCSGSCVNGPASPRPLGSVSSSLLTKKQAGDQDFPVASYSEQELRKSFPAFSVLSLAPSEEQIKAVLAKIGKTSTKDELNCSSCGYASCRDKAIAVIKGKANLEMCLPFLMDKARSFSNNIVENSINAILVLNEDLAIQLANPSFASLFHLSSPKDALGQRVSSFFDEELFSIALSGMPIKAKKIYLPAVQKYLDATISHDPQYHIVIAVFRDITSETLERQKEKEMADKTAKVTSEVIEKNMRAVQEIASLLGESTAETKVALTELQNALKKEGEGQ